MTKDDLVEKLQERICTELDEYQRILVQKGAQEVVRHSCELAEKKELAEQIFVAAVEMHTAEIRGLLQEDQPLQFIYEQWKPIREIVNTHRLDVIFSAAVKAEKRTRAARKRRTDDVR